MNKKTKKQESLQLKQELEELYKNVREKMDVIQSLSFRIDELKEKLIEKDKVIDNLIYDQYPDQLKKTLSDFKQELLQEKLSRLKCELFMYEELIPMIKNLTNWAGNQKTGYKFDEGDLYHYVNRIKTHEVSKRLDNVQLIINKRGEKNG